MATQNSNTEKEAFAGKKITPRAEDYSQWYLDIIAAADLAEHAPVRGCMIIKPTGYALWENIQKILDAKFKETGVKNAYFPLFIPEKLLKREEAHVEGFAPEVAVVTHAGGKQLTEPLVVRPTSETIMYEVFSNWIKSYRDLPLLINQWCNVVRWEMRTRLFLRTTEFLWQEGHTVHATEADAEERARMMLEVYRDFAENYMAIPVIPGQKSDSEKFAGALHTYTCEAMMQDGKALQFATSHHLGQNFAKVFNVKFSDQNNVEQFAWQTSWGLSTRTIGGLIMAHSDDLGLVLPPMIAPVQAIIISVGPTNADLSGVYAAARELQTKLLAAGVRAETDLRELRPGDKFFEWEKKGVPLRIEIGPKDLAAGTAVVARRDTGVKNSLPLNDLVSEVPKLLVEVQSSLYNRALEYQKNKTVSVDNWEDFKREIAAGNFVLAHWCGEVEVEAKIKEETGATIRCLPFAAAVEAGKCVYSQKPSARRVVFALSY